MNQELIKIKKHSVETECFKLPANKHA